MLPSRFTSCVNAASRLSRPTMTSTLQLSSNTLNKTPILFGAVVGSRMASTSTEMTWADYFKLRKEKQRYSTIFSVLGTLEGFLGGLYYFTMVREFDPTQIYFGMVDQTFIYALGVIGVTIVGAGAGSALGSMIWRLRRSRLMAQMDAKDKAFFHRISKYRAEPRTQAVNRAAPDYYGEKIMSLKDYRKWRKAQKAYLKDTEIKLFK